MMFMSSVNNDLTEESIESQRVTFLIQKSHLSIQKEMIYRKNFMLNINLYFTITNMIGI